MSFPTGQENLPENFDEDTPLTQAVQGQPNDSAQSTLLTFVYLGTSPSQSPVPDNNNVNTNALQALDIAMAQHTDAVNHGLHNFNLEMDAMINQIAQTQTHLPSSSTLTVSSSTALPGERSRQSSPMLR